MAKAEHPEDDLIEKIRALPPEKLAEVEDSVDFLRVRSDDSSLSRAATLLCGNPLACARPAPAGNPLPGPADQSTLSPCIAHADSS